MDSSPIFEYLRLVRVASYTAIVVAVAVVIVSAATGAIRKARKRERDRDHERADELARWQAELEAMRRRR